MDEILKALKKFTKKEQELVDKIFEQIKTEKTENLDVKKLKGYANIFRVRKGKIRIIYQKKDNIITLIMIQKRGENTYKNL